MERPISSETRGVGRGGIFSPPTTSTHRGGPAGHGANNKGVRRLEPSGAQRGAGGLGHEIRQTFLTLAEAGHPRPSDPDTRQRLDPRRMGIRYYFTPGVRGVSTLFAGAGGHEPFRGAPSGDGAAGTTGRGGTPPKEGGGGGGPPKGRGGRGGG